MNKSFMMASHAVEIEAGESITYSQKFEFMQADQNSLASGEYKVEVEIVADFNQMEGTDVTTKMLQASNTFIIE